jgi:hypothetical protein
MASYGSRIVRIVKREYIGGRAPKLPCPRTLRTLAALLYETANICRQHKWFTNILKTDRTNWKDNPNFSKIYISVSLTIPNLLIVLE